MIRVDFQNLLSDQLLDPSVQLQLDIVLLRRIHLQGSVLGLTQVFPGLPGDPFRRLAEG